MIKLDEIDELGINEINKFQLELLGIDESAKLRKINDDIRYYLNIHNKKMNNV